MNNRNDEEIVYRPLPAIKNDLLLRTTRGEICTRIPVWIMRQAGRHLPEYLEFTKGKDFFSICRNPEWACEVTLQPIRRYDLDAAVIFSDILVLPQSLGWEFLMEPSQGPKCTNPFKERSDCWCFLNCVFRYLPKAISDELSSLFKTDDPRFYDAFDQCLNMELYEVIVKQNLRYVYEAIHATRMALNGKVPLIGFAAAPWTLFTYISEGGSSKLYSNAKRWLYTSPKLVHCIFKTLAGCAAAFLIGQIDAGASAVQVFESHGGEIPVEKYSVFSSAYLAQIAYTVKKHRSGTPMILFSKGHVDYNLGGPDLYDVLSIDSRGSLRQAAEFAKGMFTIQGNLETAALHSSESQLEKLVRAMIESVTMATEPFSRIPPRYIANLGHGITPDISPFAVEKFIQVVHDYQNPKYRAIE